MIPHKVAKSAGACGTWVLVLFIGALPNGTSDSADFATFGGIILVISLELSLETIKNSLPKWLQK